MINTLFATELAAGKDHTRRHTKQLDKTIEIDIIKAELEEKQFNVKLTVIDTPGFGDYVSRMRAPPEFPITSLTPPPPPPRSTTAIRGHPS